MRKCVYAGSFDPPTLGHKDIIEKCLKIFDEVVVAIMVNPNKTPFLTVDERVALIKKLYKNESRVKVVTFSGAAVDLLEKENTPFYVRGVRNTVDFEYENADMFASRKLKEDMITIYIPSEQGNLHVSSSLARASVKFKKDCSELIPKEIYEDFLKITEKKNV